MPTTIAAIRATPVTVPLEAPLRHSNGAHWGRFVRTIVEVETSDGVPDAPGLGIELDRAKLARYHELFNELGGYPYDRDPGRPGWYPLIPNRDWADPAATGVPVLRP